MLSITINPNFRRYTSLLERMLYVTHHLGEVLSLADRVIVMQQGKYGNRQRMLGKQAIIFRNEV